MVQSVLKPASVITSHLSKKTTETSFLRRSTQIHISSLPFSGYFKPNFVFETVVSVCQSQLI